MNCEQTLAFEFMIKIYEYASVVAAFFTVCWVKGNKFPIFSEKSLGLYSEITSAVDSEF